MEQYTGEVYVQELASMLPVEALVRFMLVTGATWCKLQKDLQMVFGFFSVYSASLPFDLCIDNGDQSHRC